MPFAVFTFHYTTGENNMEMVPPKDFKMEDPRTVSFSGALFKYKQTAGSNSWQYLIQLKSEVYIHLGWSH